MNLLLSLLASLLVVASDADRSDQDLELAPYGPAKISGMLVDSRIVESSGLAASLTTSERFWTLNDGGNQPLIFAIGKGGGGQGFVRLESAKNQDWEDLASFSLDGQNYLGIADVGDNGGIRKTLAIYVIEEPENPQGQTLKPDRVLEFRLEDGPRDIEAMAFDARDRAFYLLSKRGFPAYLYRLPWPIDGEPRVRTASRVGTVTGIPQPNAADQATDPKGWRYRSQPTAMDFSADGSQAVVLTYGHAYLFPRLPGESWATAMARKPQLIKLPALPQGEAIAFDAKGNILISTERWPAPLLLLQPTQ